MGFVEGTLYKEVLVVPSFYRFRALRPQGLGLTGLEFRP